MVRPQTLCGFHVKSDIEINEKVHKRATKLIIYLKHLPYIERLKQLLLFILKYRSLRGDMIEVFKIVLYFCHLSLGSCSITVKPIFNTFSMTRGNKYKLQKFSGYYYIT